MSNVTLSQEQFQALLAAAAGKSATVAPPVASPAYVPTYMQRHSRPNFGEAPAGYGWTSTGKLVVDDFPADGHMPKCANPACGQPTELKLHGRFGPFVGCSKRCGFIANLRGNAKKLADAMREKDRKNEPTSRKCHQCGGIMHLKTGRGGSEFLGCGNWPKCDNTEPVSALLYGNANPALVPAGLTVDNAPQSVASGNMVKSSRKRKSA